MIDRRQLLLAALGGAAAGLIRPRWSAARQADVLDLNDRLSLASAGTNVLALSTSEGLILVDSGDATHIESLMESLEGLPGEVRTVFNTHWHLENTGANRAFAESGARIVAHENSRLWMATPHWVPAEDRYRDPRHPSAHPTETFYIDGSMDAGVERIDYGYLIEAHTSGDIFVYFRDSNVLAVGGVASPVRDPQLDYFTGAWIGGRVDAMSRLLEMSDPETRIVADHGPVMNRGELEAERDMMATIYDRAVDRVRQGDSVDDMLDAGVMEGLVRTWNDPRKFLYDVHKGLWAHHNKLAPNVV